MSFVFKNSIEHLDVPSPFCLQLIFVGTRQYASLLSCTIKYRYRAILTKFTEFVYYSVDGFIGEMRLDAKKLATDSLRPLNIDTDMETGNVSGYFFNFFDHKPTFKLHTLEQRKVTLAGGPLTAPYIMDQFHFHVYCTRKEAAENTLDGAQVPVEVIYQTRESLVFSNYFSVFGYLMEHTFECLIWLLK